MTAPLSQPVPQPVPPRPSGPTFAAIIRPDVSVGSLVSRTFSVWARNVGRFALLTATVLVPLFLVAMVAGIYAAVSATRGAAAGATPNPNAVAAMMPVIFAVAFPVMAVVMAVQMGGITYGAIQHLGGRRVGLGAMLAAGFRRSLPLVGALFLSLLMIWAGMILLIVPGIIVACALMVTIPALMAERIGPVAAIKRSWALTKDHRLAIFAAVLVLSVVNLAVNLVVQFVIPLLVQNMGVIGVVIAIPAGIGMFLVMSLPTVMPAVTYHDLRALKEGVASEDLVKVFE